MVRHRASVSTIFAAEVLGEIWLTVWSKWAGIPFQPSYFDSRIRRAISPARIAKVLVLVYSDSNSAHLNLQGNSVMVVCSSFTMLS